jgi:hypothetical protein
VSKAVEVVRSAPMDVSTIEAAACPPPRPGPPPPPAPVPPGPARSFTGLRFGRAAGHWWRIGDSFSMRLTGRVGSTDGYGRWGEAVVAAAQASAGSAGAIAICDDRGRLYLYRVVTGCLVARQVHLGARHERGYEFVGDAVRGIVDGDVTVTRGDCLHRWVPAPAPAPTRG